MRRPARTIATLLLVILVAGGAACGDDDDSAGDATPTTSAEEAACAAGDELRSSVDTVLSDIGDGNLGEARDNVAGIQSAADDLGSAMGDLEEDVRSRIEPLVDDLRSTASSLGDSSSLEELGAALDSMGSTVQEIVDELESVGCS
jgi:hypothetical protein